MIIRKRSDGVYGIIDGNHLVQISTVNGKRRCNCKNCRKSRQQADCKYKHALERSEGKAIRNNGGGGNGNGSKITNDCGSLRAKQLQDQFNGQLKKSKSGNNGNGDAKSPSQPMPLDLSDPFQECESYDIDQIEGRRNGELYWKLSNGKYCISYAGVMKLADKHNIEFSVSLHDDTNTVIAKAMNGNSRVSGKPMNGCTDTAIELAKRNAARQLLPLPEIKAMEKKAQLESEFDWQKAYDKCVKLVGGKAQLDCIIHDLVKDGKLRQDNPSHYDRTEWLIIHDACKKDADDNSCEELRGTKQTNHGDPSERTLELPNNADDFVSKCKEAIAKVRDEDVGLSPDRRFVNSDNHTITTKSIEANDQPLQNDNGDKRKLMMDKKFRTWLVESDGTKTEISCREICETFESKQNPSRKPKGVGELIVPRLRAGIDDGADISIVELDN